MSKPHNPEIQKIINEYIGMVMLKKKIKQELMGVYQNQVLILLLSPIQLYLKII